MMMTYSKQEKEVLELSKTLAPVPTETLERYKWYCIVEDWESNCYWEEYMELSQPCGDYQVVRHFLVGGNHRCEYFDDEESKQSAREEAQEYFGREITAEDYDAIMEYDSDDEKEGYIYWEECDVYCEFAQHWVNVHTGEVVFLGRPFKEDRTYIGDVGELELIRSNDKFYRFFDYYGSYNYKDLELHEELIKSGMQPMDLFEWKSEHGDYYDLLFGYETDPVLVRHHTHLPHIRLHKNYIARQSLREEQFEKVGGEMLLGKVNDIYADDYFTACKIAHRNKREDYIANPRWWELVTWLIRNGKDIHNAHYVCPESLTIAFQKIAEFEERIRRKRERQRQVELIRIRAEKAEKQRAEYERDKDELESLYAEKKGDYLNISFEYEGITYNVLHDVKSFLELGIMASQCVYSYRYYTKDQSLLLTAEVNGKYVETIELNLKTGKVVQCLGMDDKPSVFNSLVREGATKNAKVFTDIYKSKIA